MSANYEDRIEDLRAAALADEHLDFLDEIKDTTFRIKNVDASRGTIRTLRHVGVLEEADIATGTMIDYKLSDDGWVMLKGIKDGRFDVVDKELISEIKKHHDAFDKLPEDPDEEFLTLERGIDESKIRGLRLSGFVEIEQKRIGHANYWSVTEKLIEARLYLR